MIVNYKGFEIDVCREKCTAGYDLVYRNVFRIEDGYHFWADFSDSADTIREHVKDMKFQIDEYLKNPKQYEEDQDEYFKLFQTD